MKRTQSIILSFLLLLLANSAISQSNYPIYVTPTLTPPYSLKLSDYGAVGSQNLMVQINVNDLNIVDLPVKLHIKLETAGVTIETPPTITTTPVYLNGGVTNILFGEDLADYFHINNLIFKGYSKDAYKRSGQLPGGFYKFSVEVLHYNTNRLISNTGTTSAWIVLGKPPVLQLPEEGAEMGQYPGMPLSFSWLASNVGSPVSAGTIQYTFELWEMRVPGVDPNTVVQSMPVFHEETSFNTFCQVYPATLMMEPGMQYAWRVTAKDASGYVPFEQDGQSQVRTFIYKARCENISHLQAEARGRSATFTWDVESNHTSFNVELRQPSSGWMMNSETYDSKAAFFDLEQGQVYEMRVQAVCNADPSSVSDYSEWSSVKIPVQQPLIDTLGCPNCGCDDNIPQVELTNFDLRTDLAAGDTLINKTGTTRFILHKVEQQSADTYKGIFYYWAEIWGIKFVCEYENLQVNTDNVIVNMNFESVYDPKLLLDVDALKDYLGDLADDIAIVTTGMDIKDTVDYQGDFDAIYVNDNGEVVAVTVDKDGKVEDKVIGHTDDLDKTLVKDKNGDAYVVSGNGQAMGVEEFKNTGGNKRLLKKYNEDKEANNLTTGAMLGFKAADLQAYGFDAFDKQKQAIQQYYAPLNNAYRPAWKSIASFGTDLVAADTYTDIAFKDEMGLPAIASSKGLTLRGSFNGAEVPLYAYRDTATIVGKLNMVSYTPKTHKLYVIPVNKAKLPDAYELQRTLNTIYAQAIVSWQVQTEERVNLSFPGGQMTHGGSGNFTTYNADQKAIINAFVAQGGIIDESGFYLFFVDNVTDKGTNIAGYMPLNRQFGFIYGKPNHNTIAHELAHGAFNLYHTFSEHYKIAEQLSTLNLMDYKGGTELWKHQWDKIHNPENIVFGFMQDEEEGAMEIVDYDYSIKGYGGSEAVLNNIFKHKDEIVPIINEYGISLTPDIAAEILMTYYGNVKILNSQEAYGYLLSLIKYNRLCQVVNNKDILLGALGTETDEQKILDIIRENIDTATDLVVDLSSETFKFVSHLRKINNVSTQIPIDELKELLPTHLNSSGKKELLLTLSNTKFKEVLRNGGVTKNSDIQKLVNLKKSRSSSYFADSRIIDITEGLSESQIAKLLDNTSDLGLLNVAKRESNLTSSIFDNSMKLKNISDALEITGYAVDLAIAFKNIANGQELEPADLLFMIPGAPELVKSIVNNMAIEPFMWENELPWSVIKKWNVPDQLGKTEQQVYGIPGHLYLQYTQYRGKANPNILPTSFVFLEPDIANEVFGFNPEYVNYNNETGFKFNGFSPQAQSDKITW